LREASFARKGANKRQAALAAHSKRFATERITMRHWTRRRPKKFRLTDITFCNINIAFCNIEAMMTLGEKIRYMREIEGTLRGMGREMTQLEVVQAVKKELGKNISQSYLSQIESGRRPHVTNSTRSLLAQFFKVHPGYLVDDPQGYHAELMSDLRALENRLDLWLIDGAEQFTHDPELRQSILMLARHEDSRKCLLLLRSILETPGLVDRLSEVLSTVPAQKSGISNPVSGDSRNRRRNDR
jgi:transcriptional regulator with XRE-family HTH domain